MIKRVFKWTTWLSLGLIGLLLLMAIFVSTIMFTHSGLKFAVWVAEKALPQLQVERVEGALFPDFSLHNVRFVDESLKIDTEVERLTLAISFRCLFEPKVCVDELSLQGVNFQMPALPAATQEPQEETPPLRSVSTPVPIFINNVSFNDITLNIQGHQIEWQAFSTKLSMQGDRLVIAPTELKEITVALAANRAAEVAGENEAAESGADPAAERSETPETQEGSLNSAQKVASDIVLPEVWIPLVVDVERFDIHDFKLTGETPVTVHHFGLEANAEGERVDISVLELDMPEVEATLSTQVTLSGDYPLNAQLDALVKQADIKGQKLSLSASGSVADLSLEAKLSELVNAELQGTVQALNAQLPFDLSISNVKAQWPLLGESDYQVSVQRLTANGSLEGYDLTLQGKASGKEIPAVDVVLDGKGTLEQLDLASLVVKTLGGELSGQVMANWAAPINWQADLNLQHIQPGLQWPQAEGDISGRLTTSGSLTEQGGWQISLPTLDIDGVLRDYPLTMQGQLEASSKSGHVEDIKLITQGLVLAHGPNQLRATGQIDNQITIDVEVNVPDFMKSVPELSGNMNGNIAVRGSLKQPDVNVDLAVNQLNWQQQIKVAVLSLKGDVSPLPTPSAQINLVANNIVYGDINIDGAELELSGDEQQHQLTADVDSDTVSASLEVQGALDQKPQMTWDGALTRLSLNTPQGPWELQESVAIKVNIDKQTADVEAHCWLQAQSSVCLSDDISVGKSGEARLVINSFDFSQIKALLPARTKLQGSVNAQAVAKWAPNIKPEVTLNVDMPKGQVEQALAQPVKVGWERVSIQAALAKDKLDARWLVDIADNGDLTGNVALINVSSETPEIEGKVSLTKLHLDFLAPLLGEYSVLNANINTDLALSGAVMHPKLNGQFLIDPLKLQGEATPIDINSGQVTINFAGHQADLRADIATPDGQLQVTGEANWSDLQNWSTNARVFANELKVDMPPMVEIIVEPDMSIEVTPSLAKIQGQINLPWARVVVEELPPSAVGVSNDLVILDENMQPIDETMEVPFNVETNLNINIGNDFRLSAFGLDGSLRGDLNVTQRDRVPYIVGEVNIVNGSYRSFGQDLVIEEGKIIMNGPPDQPYVSIKAIRNPDNTQDDVIAGVRVTGPASEPSMAIFSEPSMAQANALSYLLRGQDIDAESSGNAMTTALIGISLAKSGRVVGEIGEAFGVQDLQLDTAGSGDESQVTVSGYILPGLQVKYGVGIFNSLGEFTLRYRLMQDLYLEAVSGVDSAVDLLYQFEFD